MEKYNVVLPKEKKEENILKNYVLAGRENRLVRGSQVAT